MTWLRRPLGEIATIERVGVDPQSLPDDVPYLGLEHIERGGRILGCQTVGEAQLASTKFRFDEGHVLFGKLRPNLGKVARPEFRGVCSTDILPIRPGEHLDKAYLHHYLAQPTMVEFAASRTSGANLPRLSPGVLATFEIPLPPLNEQRRIAAILDQTEALRAKRRQSLAHLDDLAQSVFLASLHTGKSAAATLGEAGADFNSGKNIVAEEADAHPHNRVIKVSAVSRGRFDPREAKPLPVSYLPPELHRIRAGDILFGRASGSLDLLGATVQVPEADGNLFLPDKVWRAVLKPEAGITKTYLLGVLQSQSFKNHVRHNASGAAGVRNIGKSRVLEYEFMLPSAEGQSIYASRALAITAVRDAHLSQLDRLDALLASLEVQAFAGRL